MTSLITRPGKPWQPYLYLALPLLLFAVFFFYPLGWALWISLLDYGHDLYAPQFVGFGNYASLLATEAFWQALRNTFVIVVAIVPAMITLPIAMAILLNGSHALSAAIRALVYLPVVVPIVVAGIAWKWLYANDGLVNYLLSLAGLPKIHWLTSPDVALFAVILVIVWKALAYYMMMYLSQLQSVAKELYEAAEIDGATTWQKHWHITLNHLKPAIAMVAIISTIGSLKVFAEVYVMTRGGPVGATQTLVYYIYKQAFEGLNLGLASAAGIVLMLILMVLSLVQLRVFDAEKNAP